MLEISKKVQVAYDQLADVYAVHNETMPANVLALAEMLVAQVGTSGHILELGCGPGRHMAWFEDKGLTVTGIDLSIGMLRQARQVTAGSLSQMDMRFLALSSACFDGVWACASLLHLPKQALPSALREVRRILKDKGMFVFSVQEGDFEGLTGGYVEGTQRFFARYAAPEMTDLLTRNGFAVQQVYSEVVPTRTWLSFVCLANI